MENQWSYVVGVGTAIDVGIYLEKSLKKGSSFHYFLHELAFSWWCFFFFFGHDFLQRQKMFSGNGDDTKVFSSQSEVIFIVVKAIWRCKLKCAAL